MTERYFIPGSQWLYFKIYTGVKSADLLLTNHIRSLVNRMLDAKTIDSFFFIRYNDPDFHIRLRFHIPTDSDYGAVMKETYATLNPLLQDGLILNVQCDTYARELERYGDITMPIVEQLFFIDSLFEIELLNIVSLTDISNREQLRWQLALKLVDDLCESFELDLKGKSEQLEKMADGFKKEFNFTKSAFTTQLNDLYRANRKTIAESIETTNWLDENGNTLLSNRKESIKTLSEEISRLNSQSDSPLQTESLLWSLNHMTMNRWFRTRNRIHEMVIYDFMHRYYESALARQKYNRKD